MAHDRRHHAERQVDRRHHHQIAAQAVLDVVEDLQRAQPRRRASLNQLTARLAEAARGPTMKKNSVPKNSTSWSTNCTAAGVTMVSRPSISRDGLKSTPAP